MTFSTILSEYKEKIPEFITSFDQYNEYKNVLNKDIQQSEQCLAFNNYFQEFHVQFQYPDDFKKAYDCCVIKFKLKGYKMDHLFQYSNHTLNCFMRNVSMKQKVMN